MSFGSLLEITRNNVVNALAHQDYPFSLLVEKLKIPRDASRSPIFQVMFVFQTSPKQEEGLVSAILGQPNIKTK